MTYTWSYLQKNPQEAKRLLGINYEDLMKLIELAIFLDKKQKEKIEKEQKRLIRAGGGAKPKLSVEDQILLTLIYLRQCPTFQLLGLLFQISESSAHNIFHYWLKILNHGLPPSLIEQVKRGEDLEESLFEFLAKSELIVDSLEQPRPRPVEYEEPKKCFSGKKHFHSVKSQLIVLPCGADLVDICPGERGPCSDIKIWRSRKHIFSEKQEFAGDKAYVGEPQINTPHKKPKNQKLSPEQKEENKHFSSARVFVEHTIGKLKTFRVIGEKFRLNMEVYKQAFETVCGIVRLELGALILEVLNPSYEDEEIAIKIAHIWSPFLTVNP